MRMTWTKEQDVLAYYLYRTGEKMSSVKANDICRIMQIGKNTLRRRIGNFKYLGGTGNQSHYARMTKETFEEYRYSILEERENLASKILSDHSSR